MALGRRVTQEAGIYLAGFVGAGLLQFLGVPIYTRHLGPEAYSYLSLTIALTTAMSGLMVIGGDVALARFWFEAPGRQARCDLAVTWIGFLTGWSILVAGVGALFAAPLEAWLRPDSGLTRMLLVGLVALVPAQLSRMLAQILRNDFRPTAFAVTTVLVSALSLAVGVVAAVVLDLGVVGILVGTLIAECLGTLIRLPMVIDHLRGGFRPQVLNGPLRFGIPFVPASLAAWVFTGADKIAVGRYLPEADLGSYSVAAMLVLPFTVLTTALGQAWIPRITHTFSSDPDVARRYTGGALLYSLAGFGVFAVLAALLAEPLVRIVAGPGYEQGAGAVPMLALGAAFFGTVLFAGTGYTLAKRTALVPVVTVLAALLEIAALGVLVPRWGLEGAAVAVAAAYLALAIGSLLYSQSCLPVDVPTTALGVCGLSLTGQAALNTVAPGTGAAITGSVTCLIVLIVATVAAARRDGVARPIRRHRTQPEPGGR